MATAGERCHISVWLSRSFCILNFARQSFGCVALLQGGKRGHIERVLLLLGSGSGAVLGWSCPGRAAAPRPGLLGSSKAVNLLPSGHDEAEGETETSPLGTSVIVGEGGSSAERD